MFEKKKLFLGLLAAYAFVAATPVYAINENDAILVKIQDIKPVKNEHGVTTGCEFLSTIYNRTNEDLSELSFDLSWFDEAVQNTITQEKSIRRNGRNNLRSTEDYISPDIVSTLNIPVLKKNSQKSMRGKITSDRCFILLEDAKINVSSCKKDGKDEDKNGLFCQSLFRYISSKSPEYYTDFLAVSVENQKELDNKTKERQSQELDTLFKNAEANLNKASRLLNTTVAPVNPLPAAASEKKPVPMPAVSAPGVSDQKPAVSAPGVPDPMPANKK